MNYIICLVFILFLSGCATVTKTYTSNGEPGYSLNCSGSARGWDNCFSAAGDLCGSRGYKIIDRTNEEIMNAQLTSYGFFASKSSERTMLISCGK